MTCVMAFMTCVMAFMTCVMSNQGITCRSDDLDFSLDLPSNGHFFSVFNEIMGHGTKSLSPPPQHPIWLHGALAPWISGRWPPI